MARNPYFGHFDTSTGRQKGYRQLSARQIARLGRGAPFRPDKARDGAIGGGAWDWAGTARLEHTAATSMLRYEQGLRKLVGGGADFAHYDKLMRTQRGRLEVFEEVVGPRQGRGRPSLATRDARRAYREVVELRQTAMEDSRKWAGNVREFERSIGLTRRGSKSRPMALGYVEGLGEMVRNLKETSPDLFERWNEEMGDIIDRDVVPDVKAAAPVLWADDRWGDDKIFRRGRRNIRIVGEHSRLEEHQIRDRLKYAYPDNRAAPGQGKRRERPGELRKSTRKYLTLTDVGVTVGGGKQVPYGGPIVFGWEVRNIDANNYLWATVMDTLDDVTDQLQVRANEWARRTSRRLNYQKQRNPRVWDTAMGRSWGG